MKILCVTDQFENSNHSSVEGIFGNHLKTLADVQVAYFSRGGKSSVLRDHKIILPSRVKRHDMCRELHRLVPLDRVDIVVVRNFFPVLRQVLLGKKKYHYRVGFWNSFPHGFRRYFEAKQEGRAVFRKAVEYRLKRYLEQRLVAGCDFLVIMSELFKQKFYPDQRTECLALPMGVDFEKIPATPGWTPRSNATRRLIYTGAVDHLRQTDLITEAVAELQGDFVFDIFTQSSNYTVAKIKGLQDPRIRVHQAMPRTVLLQNMTEYDCGIGLIPENDLYSVSSPTKTLEYYAVGLPALVNYLPEYLSLFDEACAFYCRFDKEAIRQTLAWVLSLSRSELLDRGQRGREIVRRQRDYKVLSRRLYDFLEKLTH
jgi:glycosyltransferase involved in cell wall biosynthesis